MSTAKKTHKLTVTAMLSAVAFLLMFIEFPIPALIPSFVKMDISDLPELLAAFSLGPVYGVAVGQDLTTHEVDGETVVDQRQFRSTFTANRLSFWQDETEVAYISNNKLYIRSAEVLDGLRLGPWQITASGGLTVQWNG